MTQSLLKRFAVLRWWQRYLLVLLALYVPVAVSALVAGTFHPATTLAEISFLEDCAFQPIWLLLVPITIIQIPEFYLQLEQSVKELAKGDSALLDAKTASRMIDAYSRRSVVAWAAVIAFMFVAAISGLTFWTLWGSRLWWWLPSAPGVYPATAVTLSAALVTSSIALTLIGRFYGLCLKLGSQVPNRTWVNPSIVSPGGSLSMLSWSLLKLIISGGSIPIVLALNRVVLGVTTAATSATVPRALASDPTTIFTMVATPLIVLIVLVVPIELSRIPSKLRCQRRELLCVIGQHRDSVFRRLLSSPAVQDAQVRTEEVEFVLEQESLVRKSYNTWPMGRLWAVSASAVALFPAILHIATSVSGMFEKLARTAP